MVLPSRGDLITAAVMLAWLALLVAALVYRRTRVRTLWSIGVSAALFGFGSLLYAASPKPVHGEWFTGQQLLGYLLIAPALGIFFIAVTVGGLVSVHAYGVRAQRRAQIQDPPSAGG